MKKIFLFSMLLFITYSTNAQLQLDDFYKDGSSWCERESHWAGQGIHFDWDYLFFIDGDTVMNNYVYHKLKENTRNSNALGGIRVSGDTVFFLRTLSIDSTGWPDVNGFIASHPLGSESILYRFDLRVGDTIKWKTSYGNVVSSITKVQLSNGDSVNQYNFDSSDTWIYGIGSVKSLFSPTEIRSTPLGYNILNYYFNPSFTYNSFPADISGCFPSSVTEVSTEKQFSIYPNPLTDNTLHITSIGIERLSVVDVTGKLVYTTANLPYGEQELYIDVATGVYILKVHLRDGTTEIRKIIKE